MRRYNNVNQISDGDNRYLETVYYPVMTVLDTDQYIISKQGDRLDLLAYEYYNDQTLWFVIATANNLSNGTLVIPAGTRIRIPDPQIIYEIQNKIIEAQQ